jgi:hypothetical protein
MADPTGPQHWDLPPMDEEKAKMLANELLLKSDAFVVGSMTGGKLELQVQYGRMTFMARNIFLRQTCQMLLKMCESNDEKALNKMGISQYPDTDVKPPVPGEEPLPGAIDP